MRALGVALLLLVPAIGAAADISVGGVSLSIPDPDEFSPVTQQMTLLYELQRQFVAPTNEQFVAFIPDQEVSTVLQGEIHDMPRRFTVQTARALLSRSRKRSRRSCPA